MGDGVLIQAESQRNLQFLVDLATKWKKEKKASWSIQKCKYIQEERGRDQLEIDGKALQEASSEVYLGMTLVTGGITAEK